MKPSDQERFNELLNWAGKNDASLNGLVEIYHDDVTKFSLRVKESSETPLDAGCPVVKCPNALTLSYANALINGPLPSDPLAALQSDPSFPASVMQSLPPHVIGRFYLIQQYLLGANSFWWPYIRTLPQPEHPTAWALPAFWPENDAEFLVGTNASVAIDEIQANVRGEFKAARKALKEAKFPGWESYSRLLYNWAVCTFTSRSFRPSTVFSDERKEQLIKFLPDGVDIDGFSLLLPVFDIANHSLTAEVVWDSSSDPRDCQLKINHAYQPGQQIFNNYGMKTNSELLLGYGFIIDETDELHNDYVHVRKRTGAGETPTDFLISLRPMNDPSSLIGRSKQRVAKSEAFPIQPELSHIDDSLIWDLTTMQITDEEKVVLDRIVADGQAGSTAKADDYLQRLIEAPPHPSLNSLLARVKNTLLAKLGYDYDRLEAAGEAAKEAHGFEVTNRNQALGLDYRSRCEKILARVIEQLCAEG